MPKCPKCGKEIDYLEYYQLTWQYAKARLAKGVFRNSVEYYLEYHDWKDTGIDEDGGYYCPECEELIAVSEREAIEFLKKGDE